MQEIGEAPLYLSAELKLVEQKNLAAVWNVKLLNIVEAVQTKLQVESEVPRGDSFFTNGRISPSPVPPFISQVSQSSWSF